MTPLFVKFFHEMTHFSTLAFVFGDDTTIYFMEESFSLLAKDSKLRGKLFGGGFSDKLRSWMGGRKILFTLSSLCSVCAPLQNATMVTIKYLRTYCIEITLISTNQGLTFVIEGPPFNKK